MDHVLHARMRVHLQNLQSAEGKKSSRAEVHAIGSGQQPCPVDASRFLPASMAANIAPRRNGHVKSPAISCGSTGEHRSFA